MKKLPGIMHIITRMDMGGSAQNTLLTCQGLSRNYDLMLLYGLSHESRMTDQEKRIVNTQLQVAVQKGVKVVPVPTLVRKISPVKDLLAFLFIWKQILREKPLIVHTHSSKAGILGRLAARLSAVPLAVHTPHGHIFWGYFDAFRSHLFLLLEKIFDPITDCQIALTEGEKNDYLKYRVARDDKLVTIHSGVEIEHFKKVRSDIDAKKKLLGINSNHPVVGTVGWLLPVKGCGYLLEAMKTIWKIHPDVQLIFVGRGELAQDLIADAIRGDVADKVKFLGWRNDIPEVMNIFDIFVLPSLNEGMGRVVVEAMAAGKPVVTSRVGGLTALVKPGQNGLLVAPANSNELSSAILSLLENPKLRYEMGQRGRKMCTDFSAAKMIEKIDRLYKKLLDDLAPDTHGRKSLKNMG